MCGQRADFMKMSSRNDRLVDEMPPSQTRQIRLLQSPTRPPMLVCFVPESDAGDVRWPQEIRNNAECLIRAWEEMSRPVAFVGASWRWDCMPPGDGVGRPKPGDLFFSTSSRSLLRDRNFQSLDGDLGAPALVLAGGSIEHTILPTAVDCALDSRPIFVASDAIFSHSAEIWGGVERLIRNSIISNYANMLRTKDIINER
jgi:hypothetical protein